MTDIQPLEPQAWLPAPMLGGKPLMDDTSIRDFNRGIGCHVASAPEQTLLLRNSLNLVFTSGTRSPSLHHVLAFLLFLPLRISLFGPRRQGWLRSRGRRPRWRRWKLGLSRLPRTPSSWLVLYQLHQAFLGFSLDAYLFW